jgi:hypothetical protein
MYVDTTSSGFLVISESGTPDIVVFTFYEGFHIFRGKFNTGEVIG